MSLWSAPLAEIVIGMVLGRTWPVLSPWPPSTSSLDSCSSFPSGKILLHTVLEHFLPVPVLIISSTSSLNSCSSFPSGKLLLHTVFFRTFLASSYANTIFCILSWVPLFFKKFQKSKNKICPWPLWIGGKHKRHSRSFLSLAILSPPASPPPPSPINSVRGETVAIPASCDWRRGAGCQWAEMYKMRLTL